MKVDITKYDTIIFDFGGVIFDINPELSINAFRELKGEKGIDLIHKAGLLSDFESGLLDKNTLLSKFNHLLDINICIEEFSDKWNAMLLAYKPKRIEKIKELSKTHKLIMLSNTNEIHYAYFSKKLENEYGLGFHDLFSAVYLSHEMHLVKPDLKIFEQVIQEQNLTPEKTLFIEDTQENLIAAKKLGLQSLLIPRNGSFYNYM